MTAVGLMSREALMTAEGLITMNGYPHKEILTIFRLCLRSVSACLNIAA